MLRTLQTFGENCLFSAGRDYRMWWNADIGGYDSGPEEGDVVDVYAGRNIVIDKSCDLRRIKFKGEEPARLAVEAGCEVQAEDMWIDENYGCVDAYDNVTIGFNAGIVRVYGRFCRIDKCAPNSQIYLCGDCKSAVINDALVVIQNKK
jgi:hypothetical protein